MKHYLASNWTPPSLTLLQTVMDALSATGRIPSERPRLDLPEHMNRDNLLDLYLEQRGGGWVANVSFREVPPGCPDTVGTPDALPLPQELALLGGAAIVCEIVTGSRELPFFLTEDELVVVAHGC